MPDVLFNDSNFRLDEFLFIERNCFELEPYGETQYCELNNSLYWVARIGDMAVGYAYINNHGNTLYIHRLAVLREHRRKGIGSLIIDSVLSYAKSMSVQACMLTVDTSNIPAYNLYLNKGFIKVSSKCRFTFNPYNFNSNNGVELVKGDGEDKFIVTFIKNNEIIGSGKYNRNVSGCKDFVISNPKRMYIVQLHV